MTNLRRVAIAVCVALLSGSAVIRAAETATSTEIEAFRARCAELAAAADKSDSMTVAGSNGWLFLAKELHHLGAGKFWGSEAPAVSRAAKPEQADPLPAILDFKAQLDKAGIELLLVPVPCKAVVYPEMIDAKATAGKRFDALDQEFYALLRGRGVHVLDLTGELIAHRNDSEGSTYCKQDSHWSGWACALAAKRIAGEVKDRPWLAGVPRLKLSSEVEQTPIDGDLRQGLASDKPAEETLWLRFVGTPGSGDLTPVEPDRQSPVILLGDSHNLVFHSGADMHAVGAGLADQLSLELGFAVDLIGVRGSGATPSRVNMLRLARADDKYLARKKLVIWCFTAREFTESAGWQKVPIVK